VRSQVVGNHYPLPFLFIERNSWLISALLASLMIAGCIAAALNTDDLLRRLKVGKA
jgi:hypothetical protein